VQPTPVVADQSGLNSWRKLNNFRSVNSRYSLPSHCCLCSCLTGRKSSARSFHHQVREGDRRTQTTTHQADYNFVRAKSSDVAVNCENCCRSDRDMSCLQFPDFQSSTSTGSDSSRILLNLCSDTQAHASRYLHTPHQCL
jgi:hypothetical protein